MFCQKIAWHVMHEQLRGHDEAANHRLSIAVDFWIIQIISVEECLSFTQNWCRFVALLTHFEGNGHTVRMLTERHLSPPLTNTVTSSLFTRVHSSPLSLAARLHGCHANPSCYINNGWTFSGQTSYVWDMFILYMELPCISGDVVVV